MRLNFQNIVGMVVVCTGILLPPLTSRAAGDERAQVESTISQVIRPFMARESIPGMAVGVALHGKSYVFDYGAASKETGAPIKDSTLFEIGSVTKTFTATLASYAQLSGRLSLDDPASKYLPALRGSHFDQVSLLNLGTHTPGGLPLQVPDDVSNDEQLMEYFQHWKPMYTPGTYRTYSNPSIGLLGMIAAKSLEASYVDLLEGKLFPALGLKSTYLNVPPARRADYAQGYTETDAPIRMAPGVLAAETYGVRTTAGDLLRFIEANMGMGALEARWQQAVDNTHVGYYRVGGMTQDLIWEQYPNPVLLATLLAGNSEDVILNAKPAVKLEPPLQPQTNVWINKTGSTNGFSTYVAFVPAEKTGIVLLANKRYPIAARVTIAQEILTLLRKQIQIP